MQSGDRKYARARWPLITAVCTLFEYENGGCCPFRTHTRVYKHPHTHCTNRIITGLDVVFAHELRALHTTTRFTLMYSEQAARDQLCETIIMLAELYINNFSYQPHSVRSRKC